MRTSTTPQIYRSFWRAADSNTHLAFKKKNNTPLANLFVSMLQSMGVETDKFASSTGTLSGLERA